MSEIGAKLTFQADDPTQVRDNEVAAREREIAALAKRTTRSLDEVRDVYEREYHRLATDATVLTHLQVLTASKVRAILRRAPASSNRIG